MPEEEARITVRLFDFHNNVSCELKHVVKPDDILIRPTGGNTTPHEWIWKGGDDLNADLDAEHRIDVAIVAEGYTEEEIMRRFSALYKAFHYGAPPHAGIAPGIDRMLMLLANEDSIREVIAFPMNSKAEDLLIGAPSAVSEKQLREANIKILEK